MSEDKEIKIKKREEERTVIYWQNMLKLLENKKRVIESEIKSCKIWINNYKK